MEGLSTIYSPDWAMSIKTDERIYRQLPKLLSRTQIIRWTLKSLCASIRNAEHSSNNSVWIHGWIEFTADGNRRLQAWHWTCSGTFIAGTDGRQPFPNRKVSLPAIRPRLPRAPNVEIECA